MRTGENYVELRLPGDHPLTRWALSQKPDQPIELAHLVVGGISTPLELIEVDAHYAWFGDYETYVDTKWRVSRAN